MFRLVKQPCTDFIPALLAELEALGDRESPYPVYVRNADQGAVITSGSSGKRCVIQVWGSVSMNATLFINGNESGLTFDGTTTDVGEAAKVIAGWFAE